MTKRSVVVIGGGLAGSLLCNELVREADVTLLELGESGSIRYPRITFDRRRLANVNTFCFGAGGTTNLWHNGLIPINPADVLDERFRDVLEESREFTDQAAARLFFKGPYLQRYREAVSAATAMAHDVGVVGDGIDCLLYPKEYHPLTVDARVTARYSVERIGFRCVNNKVQSLTYTIGSNEYTVQPTDVVVAAGAMGTPKILRDLIAESGHRFDSLGTGFIDHPLGFVGKVRVKKAAADVLDRLSIMDEGNYVVRSAIRLKSDCGRYTCCAFLRPALTMKNRLSIYRYKSLLGATTGLTRVRNTMSWRLFHPDILAEVFSNLLGVRIAGRTYNVLFVAEQRRGNNCVYYKGDELRVDWSITEEEFTVYRSLLARLRDMLSTIAEQVNLQTALTDEWLWSSAHHSGTTSMGDSASDVVDRDLKVRFFDNVYVCDGSVIQEHSYANTGLTIGQLALRLARHIVARSVV
jgi:choline dehydrogenase-like flavoprotein